MEEENQQKELFEFEKPKKPFSNFSRFFPKADFEGRVLVTLTPEQIILLAIAVLLSLVVIYAVGVEQGRKNQVDKPAVLNASAEVELKSAQSFFATTQVRRAASGVQSHPVNIAKRVAPVSAPAIKLKPSLPAAIPALPAVTDRPTDTVGRYTIAAATFKGRESAVQALNELRREGLNAFLIQKAAYLVVCVGAYEDMNNAQAVKDLARVRQRYKDAYIKTR